MYFPTLDAATGSLARFAMTATQTRHFRVNRAPRMACTGLSRC